MLRPAEKPEGWLRFRDAVRLGQALVIQVCLFLLAAFLLSLLHKWPSGVFGLDLVLWLFALAGSSLGLAAVCLGVRRARFGGLQDGARHARTHVLAMSGNLVLGLLLLASFVPLLGDEKNRIAWVLLVGVGGVLALFALLRLGLYLLRS
ncbi:MAG TPA: hypothetical protein PK668_19595 [Myxococcota bacterium]|nr:hypothetical protein [Myxococcota bacterium]HRY95063.1 hypothetical protein [Myxococcota bacterium]HSA20492.1 hypothetical protein [Myxococcota bacterium]